MKCDGEEARIMLEQLAEVCGKIGPDPECPVLHEACLGESCACAGINVVDWDKIEELKRIDFTNQMLESARKNR